jgi:para-nitrobenzyl esterase
MNLVVQTASGSVRGSLTGEVRSFKGIGFAAPPVGDLRFAPPAAAPPWSGVRDAVDYAPISLQHLDPLSAMIPGCEWNFYHPGAKQSEDCLNLNIWTAGAGGEGRPVLVWIHGGAFLAGSGTGLWCDGSRLAAEQGVVVVTVNYRLGALGGLVTDESGSSGNNMLRDQVQALRWVSENIAAFGGDPQQVTIAGESAGAMSVVSLLAAPEAAGLFRGAIVQSGHASVSTTPAQAHAATRRYLDKLDLAGAPDVLAALRAVDAGRLLDAQGTLAAELTVPFRPIIDGTFLPAPLLDIFAAGAQAQVPMLIGTNTDEHNLFAAMSWGPGAAAGDLRSRISKLFDAPDPAVVDELVTTYRRLAADDDAAWNILTTDRDWRGPVRDLATSHAAAGPPVYSYEFTYRSTALNGALRACHALDIPFVFGNLDQLGVADFVGSDAVQEPARQRVQQACVEAWGAFIRDGAPASSQLPEWPRYLPAQRSVMAIGAEPAVTDDPHADRLDRWNQLRPSAGLLGL